MSRRGTSDRKDLRLVKHDPVSHSWNKGRGAEKKSYFKALGLRQCCMDGWSSWKRSVPLRDTCSNEQARGTRKLGVRFASGSHDRAEYSVYLPDVSERGSQLINPGCEPSKQLLLTLNLPAGRSHPDAPHPRRHTADFNPCPAEPFRLVPHPSLSHEFLDGVAGPG